MISKGARLACVSLALLLATAAAPAIGARDTFSASTSSVVVEVPVQVTRDGEPVRGLTRDDFELYDGRKKVAVTGFEMLDLAATSGAVPQAAQLPVAARRHFLLLFDLTFSDPTAISRARAAAKQVLASLHPTDLVAVATYNMTSGPQLIVGFTPDRRQAAIGIDTLGLPELFSPAHDPLRLVVAPPSSAPSGLPTSGPTSAAAGIKEAEFIQVLEKTTVISSRGDRTVEQQIVRDLTRSFTNLAHTMAALEGRKYVVFLSEGFDSSLVTGSTTHIGEMNELQQEILSAGDPTPDLEGGGGQGSDAEYGDTRTQNALERMLEEFRRADCQIQAVDIGGLRLLAQEGRTAKGNGRDSLLNLAKSTNGELYENFNDLAAAMGQMLRRTGVTYVLAFQPEKLASDGAFHKLRVELRNGGRGARIVHRVGYYAPRPDGQQQPLERLLGTASSIMGEEGGNLDLSVVAAPFAGAAGRAYVPVVVEVPGGPLLAGKHAEQLPVEVYVYAVDQDGAVQGYLTQSFGLDLSKGEAALRQAGLKFFGHLDLPPGSYAVRTLVRNGASGAAALRVTPLVVPALGGSEAALLPPFFSEAPGRWVMVREKQVAGQPSVPYPFMLAGQPYIPTARPLLAAGQGLPVVVQGYNLPAGQYRASATVASLDGKEIPGATLAMNAHEGGAGGALRLSGTLQPPPLAPGEYLLSVTLTDGAGAAHTSSARFAVTAGGAATSTR